MKIKDPIYPQVDISIDIAPISYGYAKKVKSNLIELKTVLRKQNKDGIWIKQKFYSKAIFAEEKTDERLIQMLNKFHREVYLFSILGIPNDSRDTNQESEIERLTKLLKLENR